MPIETLTLTQVFPGQQNQYFDVSLNASNQPILFLDGVLYLFLVDGTPDFSWQIFIYSSADNGVTWTDITPGTPKYESSSGVTLGLQYCLVGTTIYIPQVYSSGGNFYLQVYGFDTVAVDWITDPTPLQIGFPDDFLAMQAVARGTDIVIVASNFSNPPDTFQNVMAVFDTTGAAFSSGPTQILGAAILDVASAGIDFSGNCHFFGALWPDASRDPSGTFELQHFVIHSDNSVSTPENICTVQPAVFSGHDSGNLAWVPVGQPVFYVDGPNLIAIPVRTSSTTLRIFTGQQNIDAQMWTGSPTITAGAGQVFETSNISAMFVATLMPVTTTDSMQYLYMFWVSQSGDNWDNPGASSLSHAYLNSGVFSPTTVDYSQSAQLMPGPLYLVLLPYSGPNAEVGGLLPILDGANEFGAAGLTEWWMGLSIAPGSNAAARYRPIFVT